MHSLLVGGDLYHRLVPLLVERGYRCVVPELPFGAHTRALHEGADLTPPGLARILADVLAGVGLARASIVGVDTGGALTQLLMARHRDRVDRVVLTACDAYDAFPPRSFGFAFPLLRIPGALWLTARLAQTGVGRRLLTLRPITHASTDDARLRRWTAPLLRADVRRDLAAVLAGMSPEHTLAAAEANRDFPRPVLIAWGDDARLFPRRLAQRLAAELPHSELVTIEDCAALAALDQPERLAELIDGHVGASAASS